MWIKTNEILKQDGRSMTNQSLSTKEEKKEIDRLILFKN